MSSFAKLIALWLLALGLALAPMTASAQTEAPTPAPSANDLHEFTRLLADERIQQWIVDQADQTDAAAAPKAVTLRDQFDDMIERTRARIGALGDAVTHITAAPQVIADAWEAEVTPRRQVRSLTVVLIFLFFGAGLEWLVRQYTNPLRRRLELSDYDSAKARIRAATQRSVLTLSGLMAFALGSLGAYSAFVWPPLIQALILNALVTVVAVRAVSAVFYLFFAPFVSRLRLIPVDTAMAKVITRSAVAFSAILFSTLAFLDIFHRLAEPQEGRTQAPETLAAALVLALVVLVCALIIIRICFRAATVQAASDTLLRLRRWRVYTSLLTCATFVLWVLGLPLLMWTAILVGGLIPILKLLRLWVDFAFDRATADYLARLEAAAPTPDAHGEDTPQEAEVEPEDAVEPAPILVPHETYRPIAHRLVRFAAVVCVGFVLALIWNAGIFENTENPSVAQQIFSVLLDSAAAILIADLVWTWARTAIDRRLAAYKPPEDGSAPGPEARMATLLPLLRVVLMVTLLAMVFMSILSSMGVNIAPILAGASVLGIAIGFGAQSLVRDVVSGIFFLVDDAFRVGEYVEIDQLRGTVEKISIRSLQIRHHRGAIHTLPFGELKSMTNYSRDWVIMKLEFRVPFDTDLKLVKKLIKQVGAELKANPVYGDSILETLKSQGVRRMEEFNMVVGVKFMTRPGEQWLVRRDAYQGVRDIFEANGIRMAERNVKVEIAGDEGLSETERKAVSAAAQDAVQSRLPPGPIPDEP